MCRRRFRRRTRAAVFAVLCAGLLLAPSAGAAVPGAPGGPIRVITLSDGFGGYLPEILRAEGLDEFSVTNVISMQALDGASVAILGPGPLTDPQADTLGTWVARGGHLIAMRPDPKLAGLLGLTGLGGTLANGYIGIDASSPPGAGITDATMQFHGTADLYSLAGARSVAALYSDASTPTASPAVTVHPVGSAGGSAAAFTYDLGRSVVYTRQGNPDWAGMERDNELDQGTTTIRSDDLFFPDWVDMSKIAIPQADEQQRLLANLVTQMSAAQMPLPRFWYFPRGEKAALVMTSDDHQPSSIGTPDRFDDLYSQSVARDPACAVGAAGHDQAVADWRCILATSYYYPTKDFTLGGQSADDVRAHYVGAGFELALHLKMPGNAECAPTFGDFNNLNTELSEQLADFAANQTGGVPRPATIRTHCIVWSDWASQPAADQANGIGLNTDYYFWPKSWTGGRTGMFTGSGIPMRFADVDGSLFDVYQATTQVPDETYTDTSGDVDPDAIDAAVRTLLDDALGPDGYYGAFTVNLHADGNPKDLTAADDLVSTALARGVPIISARQLLQWLDARDRSSFQAMSFADDGRLSFTIAPAAGANGLQAMLPVQGGSGSIISLTRGGAPVATTTQTIKGVQYLVFDAAAGAYTAIYPPPPFRTPAAPGGSPHAPTKTSRPQTVQVLNRRTKAPIFPRLKASGKTFRPGARRVFSLTFRLAHTVRLTWTIRSSKGKIVRRIRTKTYKKGTVLRLRWDGRDAHGHYVRPGRYVFTLTGSAHRYSRTARGSVRVLAARAS